MRQDTSMKMLIIALLSLCAFSLGKDALEVAGKWKRKC